MRYRADIDGLRAAAIVPVLLYHAGMPFLPGGFVGVDIFFVISGYLIAGLILTELDNGTFSLLRFYERRVRRILPALICIIAATLIAGWFLLAPYDYANLARSAIAALFSVSNFHFGHEAGYFDTPAEEKALLHTWSLGIEEQFYLLFPLYLIVITRYLRRWRLPLTLVLCGISFGLCVSNTPTAPSAAFFLPQMRAWEFLVGVLIAMAPHASLLSRRWAEAGAAAGLGCIALAILAYSSATPFPGFAAALPAIGSALIIRYGAVHVTHVSSLLAKPVPVFLGKISYSLYLWHLPLLAFGHYLGLGVLSPLLAAVLLAATFGLAILSWRFIELPARNARIMPSAAVLPVVGAGVGSLAAAAVLLIAMKGVPDRVASDSMRRLALVPDRNADRHACYMTVRDPREPASLCGLGADSGRPSFVLWGDSHAEALRGPVDSAAGKFARRGVFAGGQGCAPLFGVQGQGWADCSAVNQEILETIKREADIRTVILAARWGMWAERIPYKDEAGPAFVIRIDGQTPLDATDNHLAMATGLERTILELRAADKEIWIIGPVPEIGYNVPRSFFLRSIGFAANLDIRPTIAAFHQRQDFALRTLEQFSASYGINLVLPHTALCDAEHCRIQEAGRSLYFDDDHLSRFGANTLSKLFEPIFDPSRTGDDVLTEHRSETRPAGPGTLP